MKARLLYNGSSYQLLLCNGSIKKVSPTDARRFIETFDSELHYGGRGTWNYGDISMLDFGGETVARVNDDGTLTIDSPYHFRVLLSAKDINYLTPEEYSEQVGKTRSMVNRMCNNGRIPGVKKIGTRWMIPENAPYPKDGRFSENK